MGYKTTYSNTWIEIDKHKDNDKDDRIIEVDKIYMFIKDKN